MESPQSVVSPFKTSPVYPEPEKQNLDLFKSFTPHKADTFLGVLEVHIHQARDIQNICIYHKQDVYAKICLTSHPDRAVTTRTVNGGGQNPVFNETLRIDVATLDSALKCEIYMLSRVKNYLEDQLLGFAVVPLAEVVVKNGVLAVEEEFGLSSTDLFHSPAGFVRLSLSYDGTIPDVVVVPPPPQAAAEDEDVCELEKIEFPDPKVANENNLMVSEYFGLSSESLVSSGGGSAADDQVSSEIGAPFVESFSKPDSPVSTNGSRCASADASQEHDSPKPAGSVNQPPPLPDSPKPASSVNQPPPPPDSPKPAGSVNQAAAAEADPERKVVQQDFVDLYMKSMQQFTESLAKMKLPLDVGSHPTTTTTTSGDSGSDQNTQTPNSGRGTRVFYGSRAFF